MAGGAFTKPTRRTNRTQNQKRIFGQCSPPSCRYTTLLTHQDLAAALHKDEDAVLSFVADNPKAPLATIAKA